MDENNNQFYENIIQLASLLGKQNEYDEILRIINAHALSIFNADISSIIMINPRTDNTVKTLIRGGKEIEKHEHHFVQTNVVGWVNKIKKSFITNDLKKDTRFSKNIFKDTSVDSVMCTALNSGGTSIGYSVIMYENGIRKLEDNDLKMLEEFSTIVAPYLSNIQNLSEYFETHMPEPVLITKYETFGLLGKGKKFSELLKAIEAAARCDVRVLLEGQSGTGKELIAKAIHLISSRKKNPFIAVDCGAIPEQLIESEFFGHVKGSFTGAVQDRKGLFEEADKGTLFMDEISNLPLDMQAKLLRVLQENEVRIIGSSHTVKIDVRVIAASSLSLIELVDANKFREDLFYRLNVYPIYVPTLNERCDDIPLLADYFMKKYSDEQNKKLTSFHPSVIKYFKNREWKGNIRELGNFIERLVTISTVNKKIIDGNTIPKEFQNEFKKILSSEKKISSPKPLNESIENYEKEIIIQALEDNKWNQSKAARMLRISERTIRYKIEKLGIKEAKNENS